MFALRILENGFGFRQESRTAEEIKAAHAASQFRHASSGSRRGFARGADDARTYRHCHHPNLYARGGGTAQASVSRASSTSVSGSLELIAFDFSHRPGKAIRARWGPRSGTIFAIWWRRKQTCLITCSCWKAGYLLSNVRRWFACRSWAARRIRTSILRAEQFAI